MRAFQRILARGRHQRQVDGAVPADFDLAIMDQSGRLRIKLRRREEPRRREIVRAAADIGEVKHDRRSGMKLDRDGRELEVAELDRRDGGRGAGSRSRCRE